MQLKFEADLPITDLIHFYFPPPPTRESGWTLSLYSRPMASQPLNRSGLVKENNRKTLWHSKNTGICIAGKGESLELSKL